MALSDRIDFNTFDTRWIPCGDIQFYQVVYLQGPQEPLFWQGFATLLLASWLR